MKKLLLFLSCLVVIYFMSFLCITFFLEKIFSINTIPSNLKFDAVVVFYGGFDKYGNPDNESWRRYTFALDLYNRHIVKNILFTGGWRPSKSISGSEILAKKAIESGVRAENIFYDTKSRDTIQNWEQAKAIIYKNNFNCILLLSSPYHLLRIQYMITTDTLQAFFITYTGSQTKPYKTFFENIIDYSYQVISFVLYTFLPLDCYQYVIENVRT